MLKKNKTKKKGEVVETLPSTNFRVEFGDRKQALCHLSGRMRRYRIKILPGDKVLVELSPYDETRGRIVYRLK